MRGSGKKYRKNLKLGVAFLKRMWYDTLAVERLYVSWEAPCALVAQLDRVFGYEPKGRGFESLPARQKPCNDAAYCFNKPHHFLFSSALPLPSLDFRRLKPFLELLTSGIHPFCFFLCDSPSAPTVQCKRMSSSFSSPPPFSCIFCSAFYHWRCQKFLTALVENYNRHIPMSLYGIMPVSLFIF